MRLERIDEMQPAEVREYLEFLLWHYRVVDAFWFLRVAERFDQPTAERLNEEVWGRVSGMAAKDLRERFGIEERGLAGFEKTLRLFPWTLLVGFEIEATEDEVVVTVPCCATQEARRRRGLEEYVCREMHRLEFKGLCDVIDPGIAIVCEFAPPDSRPEGLDCRWRFRMAAEPV